MRVLEKSGLVSKISLGIIKKTKRKSGDITMKHSVITGGIITVIVGGGTAQEIYIYTKEVDKVKEILSIFNS
jgi:hypothetical protein